MQEHVDAIAPGHRPLFDRVGGLVLQEFPPGGVALSCGMRTYCVEKRRSAYSVEDPGLGC